MSTNHYLKCKVCSHQADSITDLKVHLKSEHKLAIHKYFAEYYHRIDRYNGTPLEFKSYEQYITCDFKDKRNYKNWLKTLQPCEAADYLRSKIKQYCNLKGLTVAPSQVECQTIGCLIPVRAMELYSKLSYPELCDSINLKNKYKYIKELINVDSNIGKVIIDTREQKPYKFDDLEIETVKLEYGDYALASNLTVSIERKSLSDFYGTLSGGIERFSREIERAKEDNGYLVVLVETTITKAAFQKRKYGVCSGDFIMHNVRKLMRTYDNVQFLFCDGRHSSRKMTVHVLALGDRVRDTDLQYYYDSTWL